jgi:NAD(P)-dependent dehydrogenase (short-subunit alcohol dehydrogenase family)
MRAYNVRVLAVLPDATDTPLIAAAPALAPHGKMTPRVVADLMIAMIAQPEDTFWSETWIAPFAGAAPPFSGPREPR